MFMRKILHNFIHCGILGWCLEITFTALNSFRRREFTLSGNTSVWMFPIYGMAAFLAPVCRMVKKYHFLARGFLYALFTLKGCLKNLPIPKPGLRPAKSLSQYPHRLFHQSLYPVYSKYASFFLLPPMPLIYNL